MTLKTKSQLSKSTKAMGVGIFFMLLGAAGLLMNDGELAILGGIAGALSIMAALVFLLVETFSSSKMEIK